MWVCPSVARLFFPQPMTFSGMLAHFFGWRKSHPAPPLVLSGDPAEVAEAEVMLQHVRERTLVGGVGGGGAAVVGGDKRSREQDVWS